MLRGQHQGKDTVPVDHPTVRILRPVPGNRRQPPDEGLLKQGPGPVTGDLDRPGGRTEDLDCFTISDIVKEPCTAGLHCQALPGHLKQCERLFLLFRVQSPRSMITEKFS